MEDKLPTTVKNTKVSLHQRNSSSHFSSGNKLEARQKRVLRTFNNSFCMCFVLNLLFLANLVISKELPRNYSIGLVNPTGLSAWLIYTPATSFKFLMGLQRFNETGLNPLRVQTAIPVTAFIFSKNTLHIQKKAPCTMTQLRRNI